MRIAAFFYSLSIPDSSFSLRVHADGFSISNTQIPSGVPSMILVRRMFFAALAVALMSGCAALIGPAFVPATGPDAATVYFGIKEPGADNVGGGSYTVKFVQGAEFASVPGRVLSTMRKGRPLLVSDITTSVQGNIPLEFVLEQETQVGPAGYSCEPRKSFCPQPGGYYEVRIFFPIRNGQLACDAQVEQVMNRGQPNESRKRVPLDKSDSTC